MDKEKWIWMPHVGHLIVGNKCRFHLNTYVGKYIVSTVGEYWPERVSREIHAKVHNPKWLEKNIQRLGDNFDNAYFKKFGFEEVGLGRTYETMVFKAMRIKKVKCCPYTAKYWSEIDMDSYNRPEDAYKGHLKMCKKWSKKP